MAEETVTNTREIAKKMIDRLRVSKQVYKDYTDQFGSNYYMCGKDMHQWQQYFRVRIPPDLNPQTAKALDMQLIELYQEACDMKTDAETQYLSAQSAVKTAYREEFQTLVNGYKSRGEKLPAQATLATMAEERISADKDSLVHHEIALAFWKGIVNNLTECRKLIENATWNLSIEYKALDNEKYMDALSKKHGE